MLIAHNGSSYLPRVLSALDSQTRPVDATVAIDTGSSDGSLDMLERSLGKGRVDSHASLRGGFGAAVRAAVALQPPGSGTAEWLWLLHDDAAPAPDALAELLAAVERAPSVVVAGCKQLDWDEPRRLVDVGISASRWAERATLIDVDEQDQGQYDVRSDVFAVNSAGMLIRRDIWDQLDGFDAALPGPGDDLDFCWRVRLAGHRVVVVPAARMFHASHRPHALGTSTAAHKAAVHLRLKHAPLWQVPFLAVGAFLGGMLRFIASLLLKDPGHGFSMMVASWAALLRPAAVARGRAQAARTRIHPRSVIKALQSSRRDIASHRRSVAEAYAAADAAAHPVDESGHGHPQHEPAALEPSLLESSLLEPSGDAADDFAALATRSRIPAAAGGAAVVAALLAAALASLTRFTTAPAVAGGSLLPLSHDMGAILSSATTWWISLGAGLPGRGDPFALVLWLLAGAGVGNGSKAVAWLLVLALPLAGLGAWFAAGALTRRGLPRAVAALLWGAAPVLLVSLNQGRLGALLAHVLLPWILLGLLRAAGAAVSAPGTAAKPGTRGVPSWTAAAATGLGLAAATAAAPALLPVAVVGIIAATLLLGRRGKTLWWALLPSAALMAPLAFSALENPRALLGDPGVPLAFDPAPLWQQILGYPLRLDAGAGIAGLDLFGPSAVWWSWAALVLVGGPVLLLAVVALVLPTRSPALVRALWLLAVLGLVGGYFSSFIATAVAGDQLVAPFTGTFVSVVFLALVAAAVLGLDALLSRAAAASANAPGSARIGRRRPSRVAAAAFTVLMLASPLASLAIWTAQNHSGGAAAQGSYGAPALIRPSLAGTLPATAADRGTGPEESRTLVLSLNADSSVNAALMRGAGTTLDSLSTIASAAGIQGAPGKESLKPADAATTVVREAVAAIMAGSGVDPRPGLTELGVGFVVLQSGDTAAELLASQIEAVPGLATVGPTDAGWLWRVTPLSGAGSSEAIARIRIVDAGGATTAFLPSTGLGAGTAVAAGAGGQSVVLAERADTRWSAWLDGTKLEANGTGWAQSFALPATIGEGGGTLRISYDQPFGWAFDLAAAVVLALTVLLAIPTRTRRPRRTHQGAAPSGKDRSGIRTTRGAGTPETAADTPSMQKAGDRG
ncbi:glycosyltransferase family 2 protein [Arthrobacter sp. 35W]|uniref:glycosyltransferase family 2 protein n=1 Tax=Arthrobacter sp. 35W TaxID=1132441 RepID=UPI00042A6BC7|nr:glycosyltransferase family 2 protein [Arthrobacter sp. 35W]